MSEFIYKRLSRDTIPDLARLFETRNKQFKIDFFKKYNTKWTGKEYIAIIAYNESEEPIGFLGSLPMFVEHDKKKHFCVQISDAIIHPDYQKRGLFVAIIKRVIDLAKTEGAEFLYVFPSPQAFNGFVKTGWLLYGNLHHYVIKTRCIPLMKFVQKVNIIKYYHIFLKFILKIIAKTNILDFANSTIDIENGGVDRCNQFLEHKNYTYNYRIKYRGIKILWKQDDGMLIGDIERVKDVNKTISRLKSLCFILGIHKLKFIVLQDSYWDCELKQQYKYVQGNPLYFYNLNSELDFEHLKFVSADLNTY